MQVQISVDEYVAGSNGEPDWNVQADEKLWQFMNEIADSSYILLPGRKMAEDFVGHFEASFKINFDLSDCDKVLRIEGDNIAVLRVMILVKEYGFKCELFD